MNEQDALTYLELGIRDIEVVMLRWPDANADEASHILWEHTPYPFTNGILDLVDAVASINNSLSFEELMTVSAYSSEDAAWYYEDDSITEREAEQLLTGQLLD